MNELSGYVFSPLREGDIALRRGSGSGLTPTGRRDPPRLRTITAV